MRAARLDELVLAIRIVEIRRAAAGRVGEDIVVVPADHPDDYLVRRRASNRRVVGSAEHVEPHLFRLGGDERALVERPRRFHRAIHVLRRFGSARVRGHVFVTGNGDGDTSVRMPYDFGVVVIVAAVDVDVGRELPVERERDGREGIPPGPEH